MTSLVCLKCAIDKAWDVKRAKKIAERGPDTPFQEGDEEALKCNPVWYVKAIEAEMRLVRDAIKKWQESFGLDLKNAIVLASVDKLCVPCFAGETFATAHEAGYYISKLIASMSSPGLFVALNGNWNSFTKIEEQAKCLYDEIRGLQLEPLIRQEWARVAKQLSVTSGDSESDETMFRQVAEAEPQSTKATTKRRSRSKRRQKDYAGPRKLTAVQLESYQTVGECNGNIAEAARRLGKDRKTVEQSYREALEKLGMTQHKYQTESLKHDRRGQANVTAEDDRRG